MVIIFWESVFALIISLFFQKKDLEWKIIYVGSAEDDRYDQVLDSIMVGPVPVGINKFVFQVKRLKSNLLIFPNLDGRSKSSFNSGNRFGWCDGSFDCLQLQ